MAVAADDDGGDLSFFHLAMNLAGGVCIFLGGIKQMSAAIKAVMGSRLREVLHAFCANRVSAFLFGAVATALLSSSNAASALVVGFVASGDMTLTAAISVSIGICVGVTVTGHLVAVKITTYALLLVFLGFAGRGAASSARARHVAEAVLGLGMLLFGIKCIGTAIDPLKSYAPFHELLRDLSNPVLVAAVAMLFTMVTQSNNATTAIGMTLAGSGLLSFDQGLALNIGGNVGSTFPAFISAAGKGRAALRIATVFGLLRLGTAAVVLPLFPSYSAAVQRFTEWMVGPAGAESAAAVAYQGFANANSAFNVLMAVATLPFVNQIADLAIWLVPPEGEKQHNGAGPQGDPASAAKGGANNAGTDTANGRGGTPAQRRGASPAAASRRRR